MAHRYGQLVRIDALRPALAHDVALTTRRWLGTGQRRRSRLSGTVCTTRPRLCPLSPDSRPHPWRNGHLRCIL